MTVELLSSEKDFNSISLPCPEREIDGAYVCDLLSWVMGRAEADNAWITIMSNVNVIAVATLTDVSCVIFAEGVMPDCEVVSIATEKGVNLLSTPLSAYQCSKRIGELL